MLWSSVLSSPISSYKGHIQAIWDLSLSAHENYFATGSADKTARLWSTEHVSSLRLFSGHFSDVDSVRFHPNSNYISTGSLDRTVRIWDIRNSGSIRLFSGNVRGVVSMCFSPHGKHLFVCDGTNEIHIFEIAESKKVRTLGNFKQLGYGGKIIAMDVSLDGRILYCTSRSSGIHFLDLQKTLGGAPESECIISNVSSKSLASVSLTMTKGNCLMLVGT